MEVGEGGGDIYGACVPCVPYVRVSSPCERRVSKAKTFRIHHPVWTSVGPHLCLSTRAPVGRARDAPDGEEEHDLEEEEDHDLEEEEEGHDLEEGEGIEDRQ